MDYRSVPDRPPIVLAARGRARTWLIGLGAALVAFSAIFATQARLTVTCKHLGGIPPRTTCHVQEGRLIGSSRYDVMLHGPDAVTLRTDGAHSVLAADDVEILRVPLPRDQLEPMREAVDNVRRGNGSPYAIAHAGGRTLDLELVLLALAVAVALQMFAGRKHRVFVDLARRELRAVSYVGFIPWSSRRTRIAPGDRAVAERRGLVLVRDQTRIVLLEDPSTGDSLEEAAKKLTAELDG